MINLVFVTYISIPIILFIYNIILYVNEKVIYSINSNKLNVMNDSFYKLQLIFCIINCILLISETIIIYNKVNISIFVFCYVATFWIINYLLKFIAIKIKYLEILSTV